MLATLRARPAQPDAARRHLTPAAAELNKAVKAAGQGLGSPLPAAAHRQLDQAANEDRSVAHRILIGFLA